MMPVIIWLVILIASLYALIKAAAYFTDSAEKIGIFLGLPSFIIGITIAAVGTSLPELISSIFAVLQGASEIVVGDVVGSNITNIFLVLGITAIVGKRMKIFRELIHVDLPWLVGSAFFFAIVVWDGVLTLPESLLCIVGIILYFAYTLISENQTKDKEIAKEMKDTKKTRKLPKATIIILAVSTFVIYIGAKYTIESVLQISKSLNIGTEIIAITAIAIGTSLPELIVSLTAVKQRKHEIAVGNILGSNIFNTFGVMGFSGLFGILIIPSSILIFALPVMLIATVIYFFVTQDRDVTRVEGIMLVLFYIIFLAKILNFF